jgi:hypothetical protein
MSIQSHSDPEMIVSAFNILFPTPSWQEGESESMSVIFPTEEHSDILRSRQVEQEVLDIIDAPGSR